MKLHKKIKCYDFQLFEKNLQNIPHIKMTWYTVSNSNNLWQEPNPQSLLFLLWHEFQEVQSKEVVTDVASIEHQSAIGISFFSRLQCDLAVFYHLVFSLHFTYHTNSLCGKGFLNNLGEL